MATETAPKWRQDARRKIMVTVAKVASGTHDYGDCLAMGFGTAPELAGLPALCIGETMEGWAERVRAALRKEQAASR